MYRIHVMPADKEIYAEGGENLLALLRQHKLAPDAPCGGNGKCEKCRVVINGAEALACRTEVHCDTEVIISSATGSAILTASNEEYSVYNPIAPGYSACFDIGTTTVVCYLLNADDGSEICSAAALNPQRVYGADVISRIQSAVSDTVDAQAELIRSCMEGLISECCEKSGIAPADVGTLSVVGNPCMQQLFMRIDTKNLASVPFSPEIVSEDIIPAAPYISICPEAVLTVVPDISGYVGADTVACILSTGMYRTEKTVLMVDIGTNGEMVLSHNGRLAACSTAAGPALEGANIRFGMRGAEGAIDRVEYKNGSFSCHVIGDSEAAGICGTGLVDAVSEALKAGIINRRGRISSGDEIYGERIIKLSDAVYLTQNDIREFQLAKGAISTGISLLARHFGIGLEEIDEVLLAGAFGSYMNPASAVGTGLIPRELKGKIRPVGNAAGAGAKAIARDRDNLALCGKLARMTEFIELADEPDFEKQFAKNMYL